MANFIMQVFEKIFGYLGGGRLRTTKKTCRHWCDIANRSELITIASEVSVDATTISKDGRRDTEDHEHMEPVIKNHPPHRCVLPKDYVVFQPDYTAHRYQYRRHHYAPAELTIRFPRRATPYHWELEPNMPHSRYDSYCSLPATNSYEKRHCFTIYDYFHPRDIERKYPVKVFYKTDPDSHITLHAVSIPLRVLEVIACRQKGCNCQDEE
jgi:hypothetical protein